MASSPALASAVLRALRAHTANPALEWDRPPRRLLGGSWCDILAVRLRGAPGLEGELVVRILPDPHSLEREVLVQDHVARNSTMAPRIHLSSPSSPSLDRAWILMDFVDGRRFLDNPTRREMLGAVVRNRTVVPNVLAETTVALHAIDARPIAAHLSYPQSVGPVLEWLYSSASALGEADLIVRAERLLATRPTFRGAVLCHGDLHPLNILRAPRGNVVIDWSEAQYDDPHYDLAFTTLALDLIPTEMPRWVRPVVQREGRAMARRFLDRYREASGAPIDDERLAWFRRLVALRAMMQGVLARDRPPPAGQRSHPAAIFDREARAAGF